MQAIVLLNWYFVNIFPNIAKELSSRVSFCNKVSILQEFVRVRINLFHVNTISIDRLDLANISSSSATILLLTKILWKERSLVKDSDQTFFLKNVREDLILMDLRICSFVIDVVAWNRWDCMELRHTIFPLAFVWVLWFPGVSRWGLKNSFS